MADVHYFDVKIAKEYGINCAVILQNMFYWINKNVANNENFYDDTYWTYNSKKALSKLFPYMNERQIDYALKKLIDNGIIKTGNYNKMAYDRTLWYAITKKGYSILQNCEMEATKLLNGSNKIVEPIPNNKPYINTNNKPYIKKNIQKKTFDDEFAEIWKLYPRKQGKTNAYKSFIKARKKGTSLDEILKGLNNYLNHIQQKKIEPNYIKQGSTWFNQECWNDEYEVQAVNTGTPLTNKDFTGVYEGYNYWHGIKTSKVV